MSSKNPEITELDVGLNKMNLSPEFDNILGKTVMEMVDEHICTIRDLLFENYPEIAGFIVKVTEVSDGHYHHKMEYLIKESDEKAK